uniref:Uncharacterized protein n=1 Tax=Anguilla anguilla TaxID=7936 RepID=A0A0E9V3B2_ANGAN
MYVYVCMCSICMFYTHTYILHIFKYFERVTF